MLREPDPSENIVHQESQVDDIEVAFAGHVGFICARNAVSTSKYEIYYIRKVYNVCILAVTIYVTFYAYATIAANI
jgi:hypothetical protein